MPLGRQGPLSKLIGGGIGLTKEYQADRQKHKEGESSQSKDEEHHDDANDEDEGDGDDETWAQDLDAAQLETVQSTESIAEDFDEKHWMDAFFAAHPPPLPSLEVEQPLSMPVILPERRPGMKTRGFVRAYAPILADAGIDESTWIEFLKGFDKSKHQHKYFHYVNAAVWVADKVRTAVEGVSIIARFVTMAIHLSVEAGRRAYMNKEENKFLDRMNDEFFKPRGLFAMVIKFDPKSDEPDGTIDVTTGINQKVAKRDDDDRSNWKNYFQGSSGKTHHEDEIPEFAPLVFPELDNLPEEKKEGAVKHFGSFMGEYYDRRGQAKFDAENEDSKLSGVTGEHEFASRYSDPNSAASKGGLVSTFSGGKIQYEGPLQKLTKRRNDRRSRLGISRQVGPDARKHRKNRRPMRKFLKQDVLYLMVVNMPTQEEMDLALQELEEVNKQAGANMFDLKNIRAQIGLGGGRSRRNEA